MRADQLLVEQGLAPTRSAAQRLIEGGAVRWRAPGSGDAGWRAPRKAGETLPLGSEIEVTDRAELRWASRAGLKLEGALKAWSALDGLADAHRPQLDGITALDIGQSTGGFTDVLLHAGAARVVGVDVGRGQLVPRLRQDPRVSVHEGLNARELTREPLGTDCPSAGFELIVGDLSFISQTLVWPALVPLLHRMGNLLMLVKPQFELQPQHIGKGGLVKPTAPVHEIEPRLRALAQQLSLQVLAWMPSPITGGDGNNEHFILMRHAATP